MSHKERITKIIKLDLKLQCQGQVYVIIGMHMYLLMHMYMSCSSYKHCSLRSTKQWGHYKDNV